MLNWYLEEALERSQDRVRAAEQARIVQEALAAADSPPGWRDQALVQVGGWLVALGHRMELAGRCAVAPMMTADTADQR
jgi:hypothetical protein